MGPFTEEHLRYGALPVWSAGRLLTLLTTSEDFYWSLYRAEETGLFTLTVYADGKETKFTDERLINVALPAMLLCIETGNLDRDFEAFKADRSGAVKVESASGKWWIPEIEALKGKRSPMESDAIDVVKMSMAMGEIRSGAADLEKARQQITELETKNNLLSARLDDLSEKLSKLI